MKRVFILVALVVVFAAAIQGWFYYDNANRDFTPWMPGLEFAVYVQKFDTTRPGETEWKKTHWLTAVEGRWHDGAAEYRLRSAEAPKGIEFTWNWFINMDQAAFSEKIQDFGAKGFVLVQTNSYKLPDGTTRYQSVWHKPGR